MEHQIVDLEAYLDLREQVDYQRKLVARFLVDKALLSYCECPEIEWTYLARFGDLEYQVHEISLLIRRLERKSQLIDKPMFQADQASYQVLEDLLDRELDQDYESLYSMKRSILIAQEKAQSLPQLEEDKNQLVNLFKQLLGRLHPLLYPLQAPLDKVLYRQALACLESKALTQMEWLAYQVDTELPGPNLPSGPQHLKDELARLKELRRQVEGEILSVKESLPYLLKPYITFETMASRRKQELIANIKAGKQHILDLESKLEQM